VTIGSSFWPPSATFSFVHPEGILSESFKVDQEAREILRRGGG
jgi:hypothetical protein